MKFFMCVVKKHFELLEFVFIPFMLTLSIMRFCSLLLLGLCACVPVCLCACVPVCLCDCVPVWCVYSCGLSVRVSRYPTVVCVACEYGERVCGGKDDGNAGVGDGVCGCGECRT